MDIVVYDSLNKRKRKLTPITPGKIGIYVCGVTVYDRCHLGHARGAINFDVLRRFLQKAGYEVLFVKNYTDIDDKIIQRAGEKRIAVSDLTEEMITEHDRDMEKLFVLPPDIAPKATENIVEMIAIIGTLMEKGFAYQAGGDVLFRIAKFSGYGKLSGKNPDDLIAGTRVEIAQEKENPLDFVLWKAAKPDEPSWQSPWGAGRPGWHIECSAMSQRFLGKNFDLHLGGSDLIFPHHENEIAQSESANQCPFANYWMHTGMINIRGEKMSKSLGNFALIHELCGHYHPELIRFYVLQSHYRQGIDFSHEGLLAAKEGLDKIYEALLNLCLKGDMTIKEISDSPEAKVSDFMDALADDLNTPVAIAEIFKRVKSLNSLKAKDPKSKEIAGEILTCGKVLGILNSEPLNWFQNRRIEKKDATAISPDQILNMITERENARQTKDFALADQLRNELKAMGILLKDGKNGAFWLYE